MRPRSSLGDPTPEEYKQRRADLWTLFQPSGRACLIDQKAGNSHSDAKMWSGSLGTEQNENPKMFFWGASHLQIARTRFLSL